MGDLQPAQISMSECLTPLFSEERVRSTHHAPLPTILLELLLSKRLTSEWCREHYLLVERPIEASANCFHGESCPMMTIGGNVSGC